MGKGTVGVPTAYGAAQEVPLTLSEAGVAWHEAKRRLWRTRACGRKGQAASPLLHPPWQEQAPHPRGVYHTNYTPTPCTSKVTSLPDVGGLAVQGRKAGRHNGCIREGSFFPSCGVQGMEKDLLNALPSVSWATGHVTSQALTVRL